jgi:1-acyl-sn-glycerol-3-phosphate acyltransferase
MQRVRAFLFALFMVGAVGVLGAVFLPLLIFPGGALKAIRVWSRSVLWALRVLCGVRWEVRGVGNIPPGAVILAAKHQSTLDTIVPFVALHDPCFALKSELMKLPFYGWYAARAGMIPIDRGGHSTALRSLVKRAKARMVRPTQLVIYPEGTRRPVGAPPAYKPGVAGLYRELEIPCVPVATNSGQVWGGKGFSISPGLAVFEFLPPIPPGLKRPVFMAELERRIEDASDRLAGG